MRRFCPTCAVEYEGGTLYCPQDGTRLEEPILDRKTIRELDEQSVAEAMALVGGRYRVEAPFSIGTDGRYFQADHVDLQQKVTLKLLRADEALDEETLERFRREAQAISSIAHPNLMQVRDFHISEDGSAILALNRIEGHSLETKLRQGPIPIDEAFHYADQILAGLGAAHQKNIIHRDIRPCNIAIHEGHARIVEFGSAKILGATKLTKQGLLVGAPQYMSPESAAGHAVDARADLYSLGITLYEMLFGAPPFGGDSFMEVLDLQMNEPHRPPSSLNRQWAMLDPLFEKALAKRAENRFSDAAEFRRALATIRRGDLMERPANAPVVARTGKWDAASAPELPINSLPKWIGGIFALVALVGIAGAAAFWLIPSQESHSHASVAIARAVSPTGHAEEEPAIEETSDESPPPAEPAEPEPAEPAQETRLVEIDATPRAQLWRGNTFIGETPLSLENPSAGEYELRRRGYEEVSFQIEDEGTDRFDLELPRVRRRHENRQSVMRTSAMQPSMARPPGDEMIDPWAM